MYDNERIHLIEHSIDTMNLAGIFWLCGTFQLHFFVCISILMFDSWKRSRPVPADLQPKGGGRPSLPQRSQWMWDSEVGLVERSQSLVLTCATLPWLLQSSYSSPLLPAPREPHPLLHFLWHSGQTTRSAWCGLVLSWRSTILTSESRQQVSGTPTDPLTGVCADRSFLVSRF